MREIVAFCFYENPVTDIYFSLKPGYEELAPEMITYADEHIPKQDGKNQLILLGEQTYDMDKISKCCWKGFDHEETEGAWDHQHEQNNYQLQAAPMQQWSSAS